MKTRQEMIERVKALHAEAPGTWIRTDHAVTEILETAPASEQQPMDGGVWWRTHHLLRTLGINC